MLDETGGSGNVPLLFLTLESPQWIVFNSTPTITISLPSTVPLVGQDFYLVVYETGSGGPTDTDPTSVYSPVPIAQTPVDTWVPFAGPATPTSQTLVFTGAQSTFNLPANQPVYLALMQSSIATLNMSLSAPLTMGTSSSPTLGFSAYDQLGGIMQGAPATPITISNNETSGRTTLGNATITDLSQTVPLTYDGKGDQFTITAAGPVTSTLNVTTTLPQEALLATPIPGFEQNVVSAPIVLDGGTVWSTIFGSPAYEVSAYEVADITTGGVVTLISDPNAQNQVGQYAVAKGGDGNIWVSYNGAGPGLDRVTTSGVLTSFPFTGTLSTGTVGASATAPDGSIWSVVGFGTYPSYTGYAVARTDMTGNTTEIGALPTAASNLVFGPDGNLWFATSTGVGKITASGTATTYALPGASANAPLMFVVGSDGNFWAPYAYGTSNLLKFSTSGVVVSKTALPYSTPWNLYPTGATVPTISSLAVDSSGNVYAADAAAQGLIRITPAGSVAEYPTYSGQDAPANGASLYVTTDSNNNAYVVDVVQTFSGSMVGGLSIVGASSW